MPSRLSWLALGGGAYLAFALAQFPASVALRWFAPNGLAASGITGTVWQGAAAGASVAGLPLTNLRWRVDSLPLLIGRLGGEFEARLPDGFVNGGLAASLSRVRLTDLRFSTTLQSLNQALPLAATEGRVSAQIDVLVIEDGVPVDAVGELRVAELAVAPLVPSADPGLIPLGDYVMTFTARAEPGLYATIDAVDGPLDVTGSLTLAPDGAYRLEGRIGARADALPMLVEGLTVMQSLGYISGEPDREGRREFLFPGRLSSLL